MVKYFMKKFIELSHTIEDGMKAYPGYPNPKVGAFITREASRARYGGKAEFYIGRVEMVGNVGGLTSMLHFTVIPTAWT